MRDPDYRRNGRPIFESAVPVAPCFEIVQSCRFLGTHGFPGCLGRFMPGAIGTNLCGLCHMGLREKLSWSHLQKPANGW